MPEATASPGRASAVSNAINRLHRDFYGRGGTTARTVIQRNFVVVFLDDIYTQVERTLIEDGKIDTVRETRAEFQLTMTERFSTAIERDYLAPWPAELAEQRYLERFAKLAK